MRCPQIATLSPLTVTLFADAANPSECPHRFQQDGHGRCGHTLPALEARSCCPPISRPARHELVAIAVLVIHEAVADSCRRWAKQPEIRLDLLPTPAQGQSQTNIECTFSSWRGCY